MPFLGARGQASRGYFGGGTPPDAPTSVVATRGNTQLSVAFSAPAFNGGLDITTYQYALSTDSYATWTTRSTGTTASPLVITGLANGTSYQVKLRAVNALGEGAASDASTAVTPATIPGTPTSPSISSGSGSISVSWGAPSDGGDPPLTYTVETQKNSEAYVNRGAQTSTYTLSGLDNGATYRARITANNTVGSSATPAVTGDTVPSAVPGAPGFSSASSGSGTYTFNWTAPANNGAAITSYTVTLTTANQAAWGTSVTDTPANFTSGGNLTYTFTGLSNGSSYRAKVLATNVRGNGAETDSGAGGAQTPSTVPSAPTISSQSAGDKSYTVNWNAPANGGAAIDYYEVQITDADEQNWSTIASPNPTGTTQTFNGVLNGKTYRTRVRAHNVRGFSGYVESTAQTPSFAAPTISAADIAGYGDGNNSATWYIRPVRATVSPTACVDYLTTTISLRLTDVAYMDTKFGDPFTASTANQTSDFFTYTMFGSSFNIGLGTKITVTATTYNTDNYSRSTSFTYTTSSGNERPYDTSVDYTTDTIKVTGGSMARAYFDFWADRTESVRSAKVYGKISGSSSTVSAGRNPSVGLSSATSSTGTGGDIVNMHALNGNVNWAIGPTERFETWNHTNLNTSFNTTGTGVSEDFAQRYSVAGDGTIPGTWIASEQINVRLDVTYIYRTIDLI